MIILVNENRPFYVGRIYALPSGRVDKEDDPKVGAQRELQEEAGVKAGSLELFMKSEPSNNLRYDRYVYIARDLEPSRLAKDPDEDIVVAFKTLEQAALLALEGQIRPEIASLAVLRFQHAVNLGRIKL